MDNPKDVQCQVKLYEKKIGHLTDEYPFDFNLRFIKSNEPFCSYRKSIELHPNKTFKGYLSFKFDTGNCSSAEFSVDGKFSYNAQKRLLTLEENSRTREKCEDCANRFDEACEQNILKVLDKHFPKKIEIPNYTWISETITMPTIMLQKEEGQAEAKEIVGVEKYYGFLDAVEAKYHISDD